eukprot:13361183-Heterocapsa_arctica.AAC.1
MHSNGGRSTVSSQYFASSVLKSSFRTCSSDPPFRSSKCVVRMPTNCFRLCFKYTLGSAFVGYHFALIRLFFNSRPHAPGAAFVPKPGFSMLS